MHKRLALFVISVLLVLLTINFFGLGAVIAVVAHSDWSLVGLAVLCQVAIILLYALRFKVMTSKYKRISFREAFRTATIGNFISLITPVAKVGGQPLMIYMTKKKIGNEKSSAVVFMDTMIDMLTSVVVAALVLVIFYPSIPLAMFWPLLAMVIVAFILIFGFMKLFLSRDLLARIFDWIIERMRRFKRIDKILHANAFERSFRLVLQDKKIMSAGMIISFFIKVFEVLRIWIIFLAIGIVLTTSTLWIIWAFMLLILMIPWLPGHLGLYEFGVSSGFILLGIASVGAAGGVLLDRFVSFWFVMAFSVVVIWLSRERLGEVFAIAEKK
jgi:hypothetical protein